MDPDLLNPQPLAQMPSLQPQQSPLIAAAKPKINWLGVLADALAGAAGRQGPYAQMMLLKRQQDLEDQRSQTNSDRELAREKSLFDYEQANKAPDKPSQYEQMLAAIGVKPGTPEYVQHMSARVKAIENPPYFYTDPASGQTMVIPRNAVPGTPAPDGITFTPLDDGGPSPGGSGGFPR